MNKYNQKKTDQIIRTIHKICVTEHQQLLKNAQLITEMGGIEKCQAQDRNTK